MVDQNTILALKHGDQSAYAVLYKKSIAYVYTVVRQFVEQDYAHQDIIQDIYARVFLNIQKYDEQKGPFKPWIRRIAINQCFDFIRKNNRETTLIPIEQIPDTPDEEIIEFTGINDKDILKAVDDMPKGYKNVFLLIMVEGYDHQEVSQIMEISEEASRSQLSRAKGWLRKRLNYRTKQTKVNGFK